MCVYVCVHIYLRLCKLLTSWLQGAARPVLSSFRVKLASCTRRTSGTLASWSSGMAPWSTGHRNSSTTSTPPSNSPSHLLAPTLRSLATGQCRWSKEDIARSIFPFVLYLSPCFDMRYAVSVLETIALIIYL